MSVSRFTENMMARFPSWMKMAKDPDSVGAQFLDVSVSHWLNSNKN